MRIFYGACFIHLYHWKANVDIFTIFSWLDVLKCYFDAIFVNMAYFRMNFQHWFLTFYVAGNDKNVIKLKMIYFQSVNLQVGLRVPGNFYHLCKILAWQLISRRCSVSIMCFTSKAGMVVWDVNRLWSYTVNWEQAYTGIDRSKVTTTFAPTMNQK